MATPSISSNSDPTLAPSLAAPIGPSQHTGHTATGDPSHDLQSQETDPPGSTGPDRDVRVTAATAQELARVISAILKSNTAGRCEDTPVGELWTECAGIIQDHHKALIAKWTVEIDTLLVYAGLFSAVLTAFNVESYLMLRPADTIAATNAILAQISAQLNTTQPTAVLPDTLRPTTPAVIVNALWFSSLVCSLSAATVAMIVKQWLGENELGLSGTSRDFARRRQYRYTALVRWRVKAVMASLPIILQIASALFLAGLLVLLWTLHHLVAIVASVPVGILVLFSVVATIGPTLYLDCAYRSPLSLAFYTAVQACRTLGRGILILRRGLFSGNLLAAIKEAFEKPAVHMQWAGMERIAVKEREDEMDQYALETANALMLDDHFTDRVIRPCMRTLPIQSAHECFGKIRWDQFRQTRVDFNTGTAVNTYTAMALDVIEPYLCIDGACLDPQLLDHFANDLWHIPRNTITANVSERLYQVLARLLRSSAVSSNCTGVVWRILDDLSWSRVAAPANDLITCGRATRDVESALQMGVEQAWNDDLPTQLRARCQLTRFLATCHIASDFSPADDREYVRKRLLEELKRLEVFLYVPTRKQWSQVVKLAQKTDGVGLLTEFPEILTQLEEHTPDCVTVGLVKRMMYIMAVAFPKDERKAAWYQLYLRLSLKV